MKKIILFLSIFFPLFLSAQTEPEESATQRERILILKPVYNLSQVKSTNNNELFRNKIFRAKTGMDTLVYFVDINGRSIQLKGPKSESGTVITDGLTIQGDGSSSFPIKFVDGTQGGEIWYFTGTEWVLASFADLDKNGPYSGNGGNGGDGTVPSSTTSTVTDTWTIAVPSSVAKTK